MRICFFTKVMLKMGGIREAASPKKYDRSGRRHNCEKYWCHTNEMVNKAPWARHKGINAGREYAP